MKNEIKWGKCIINNVKEGKYVKENMKNFFYSLDLGTFEGNMLRNYASNRLKYIFPFHDLPRLHIFVETICIF